MTTTLTVGGKPVNIEYIKDAIATVGPVKFLKLNPWARDALPVKKPTKKTMSADQRYTKTVLSHHAKELGLDLRNNQGWSVKDVATLWAGQRTMDKRLRREARDNVKVEPKASPQDREYLNALDRLNNSFAFKKTPQVRHYKKKRKPLLFEKNRKKKHSLR